MNNPITLNQTLILGVAVATLLGWRGGAHAATRTTAQSGYWTNTATWTDGGTLGLPQTGDQVIISHAVTLDETTPELAAFSNNATLTFLGTNTALRATEVTVNATMTHNAQTATSTNEFGMWVPDNRVWIICSNLTVIAGKIIDANGKGYVGGISNSQTGKGPGGGNPGSGGWSAGGGYGGRGGNGNGTGAVGGGTYGSTNNPVDPGSGGAFGQANGGAGGGAIRIEASGHVRLEGTIRADGGSVGNQSGGGAGGGVWITCNTIGGTGTISVVGGYGGGYGGGGGGGRVAIEYNSAAQALLEIPSIQIAAGRFDTFKAGAAESGEPGTIWLPDSLIWPRATMYGGGDVVIPGFTSWSVSNLTLGSGWFRFTSLTNLVVENNMTIQIGQERTRLTYTGRLTVGNSFVLNDRFDLNWQNVGPNPSLRRMDAGAILLEGNNARMHVFGGVTNEAVTDAGLVAVQGDFVVSSNTILYPYAHPTNGGTLLFTAGNFFVLTNGMVDADAKGYAGTTNTSRGLGPGGSPWNGNGWIAGAGYGGKGGNSAASGEGGIGGPAYGVSNAPVECGSASARGQSLRGWSGGGSIRIIAAQEVRIDGTLSANGESGLYNQDGGGSGGGIFIQCKRFMGNASGVLQARGGNGRSLGGGGGGGRIAVFRSIHAFEGTPQPGNNGTSVDGGTGYQAGAAGTVFWGENAPKGTVIMLR